MYHIRANKTNIGIIFVLLIIVSFQNVYATDYVDSTGYTPSWAYSLGQYQTLAKCLVIIEIDSQDGNWCFEWAAYTLDMENNYNTPSKPIDESLKQYLPSSTQLGNDWLITNFAYSGKFNQNELDNMIESELSRGYYSNNANLKGVATVAEFISDDYSNEFFDKLYKGITTKVDSNKRWSSNDNRCIGMMDLVDSEKYWQHCVNGKYVIQIGLNGNKNIEIHKNIANEFSNIFFGKFESKIPEWVKNTMQWYLDGLISEDEMIKAIQFLVKENIIKI
jgi:hypothetical protein